MDDDKFNEIMASMKLLNKHQLSRLKCEILALQTNTPERIIFDDELLMLKEVFKNAEDY
ncbi:hypothetical protein [Photobacterium atrarenae]|uniref:Uncharacterized protein n=1 Tax=Photobacterium atrarenae TaxID=865757 RepID=A0ABY5GNW5_9GAMM|nr:hypothetical protein [Photobacterium atrarenae]UTV31042.1 hypothetical protein NNL38_24460 [Photobacterium atrarenae]